MKALIQTITIIFFGTIAFVSNASAQPTKLKVEGKLNTWTYQLVQRDHSNSDGCLSKVRVAKNKGFDRIVFELGELNSYIIYYLPSNIGSEGNKIRIAGKVFMNIDLYGIPCETLDYPEGKLKLPVIQQITGYVFEGIQTFAIGVKVDNLYRVRELKNPARLVIDFKH